MERDDLDEDLDRISQGTEELAPRDGFTSRVMGAIVAADAEDDPLADAWASLADRTAGLEPSPRFTARVMDAVLAESAAPADPLEVLARRTDHLDASPDFDDRLMTRIRRESHAAPRRDKRTALGDGLARNGLKALFAAAAVAAAAMFYASYSERDLDADVLASVDTVEAGD